MAVVRCSEAHKQPFSTDCFLTREEENTRSFFCDMCLNKVSAQLSQKHHPYFHSSKCLHIPQSYWKLGLVHDRSGQLLMKKLATILSHIWKAIIHTWKAAAADKMILVPQAMTGVTHYSVNIATAPSYLSISKHANSIQFSSEIWITGTNQGHTDAQMVYREKNIYKSTLRRPLDKHPLDGCI